MIEFHCSKCNAALQADDSQAARKLKCPDCGTDNEVPVPDYYQCPNCGKEVELKASSESRMERCPHCGNTFFIQAKEGAPAASGCAFLTSMIAFVLVSGFMGLVVMLVR